MDLELLSNLSISELLEITLRSNHQKTIDKATAKSHKYVWTDKC